MPGVQRAVVFVSAAAATLVAWLWLLCMPLSMPAPLHHLHSALLMPGGPHPLTLLSFLATVAMWQVMMVAMMTPAVLPWLLAVRGRARLPAFAAGYFVVWLVYSIAGAALQTALQHAGLLEVHGNVPARLAGVVLIAAALFSVTPLRRACLKHCRNPLTYFLKEWPNRPRGGFAIGLDHGAHCVGCCWALMLTGLAMGVMNLTWMALLTLLISLEQLVPHGDRIGQVAALAMAVWGVVLIL
jgi:predicted metal-binding membrane protein